MENKKEINDNVIYGKNGEVFLPNEKINSIKQVPVKEIFIDFHNKDYGSTGGISIKDKNEKEYGTDIDNIEDAVDFLKKGTYEYIRNNENTNLYDIRFITDKNTTIHYSEKDFNGKIEQITFNFEDLMRNRNDVKFITSLNKYGLGKVLDFADKTLEPQKEDIVEIKDINVGIDEFNVHYINYYSKDRGDLPDGFVGEVLEGDNDITDKFDLTYDDNRIQNGPIYIESVQLKFCRNAILCLDCPANEKTSVRHTFELDFLKNPKSDFTQEFNKFAEDIKREGVDIKTIKFFNKCLNEVVEKYRKDNGLTVTKLQSNERKETNNKEIDKSR